MKLPGCFLALLTVVTFTLSSASAAEVEWTPEVYMDDQLYPSLLIATASVRPVEDEDREAEEPDPYLLGERFTAADILYVILFKHARPILPKSEALDAYIARGRDRPAWRRAMAKDSLASRVPT